MYCTQITVPRSQPIQPKLESLKSDQNGVQNAPQGMKIVKKGFRRKICTIGGALEHQKVQKHQKFKCVKMHFYIHQNDRLGELIKLNTTKCRDIGIGC